VCGRWRELNVVLNNLFAAISKLANENIILLHRLLLRLRLLLLRLRLLLLLRWLRLRLLLLLSTGLSSRSAAIVTSVDYAHLW